MNTLRLIQQFSNNPDGSSSSESSGEEFMLNLQAAVEEDEYAGPSTRTFVHRDCVSANEVIMNDYFVEDPKYNVETFRERYRMSKELFLKIVNDIKANCDYFLDTYDASNRKSFTPIQKCTLAIRQLATCNPLDEFDEYLEFLRAPTSHDIAILYETHEEKHGIPEMIGSIDCTHWDWRNCPTSLRGQFHRGDHQYPTMILEAVASNDLWIWHAYFGTAGSNNDINVLQCSPLLQADIQGKTPRCPFVLNNLTYNRGYYLVDDIYLKWPIFVKTILYPSDEKEEKYKKVLESARKDVERTFGALKGKWGIIRRLARAYSRNKIKNEMYACCILHNMILKDEGKLFLPVHIADPPTDASLDVNIIRELRITDMHHRLRFDLV